MKLQLADCGQNGMVYFLSTYVIRIFATFRFDEYNFDYDYNFSVRPNLWQEFVLSSSV